MRFSPFEEEIEKIRHFNKETTKIEYKELS
jgi:hypothetical protein